MTRERGTRRLRQVLKETFGLTRLRPGQQAVIDRVLEERSTLAIMPTGAGKSLCYQLPALLLPGRTVVVSPLISLMKDQCESLRAVGVPAVQLNSAVDSEEARQAQDAVADGTARIVMVTPERWPTLTFCSSCARNPPACWWWTKRTASRSGAMTSGPLSWRSVRR